MIRHIRQFKLYVFLLISLIYSDEVINIPLDPISHNNFYLNSIYPKYQPDLFKGEYFIEGNLGSPLSVYMFENLETDLNDSVRTNSSLLYNQGDVGYRNITVDIKTRVDSLGILKLTANGLSYPGRISQYASDNILQNYLLHFSKKYNSSILSFYSGYHIENRDLNHINSNSGESYFSGINYNIFKDQYELNLKYAFQMGKTNYETLTNYRIMWGIFDLEYYLTKTITSYISNTYKNLYFDGNIYYLNNSIISLSFENDLFSLKVGTNSQISNLEKSSSLPSIFPELTAGTKLDYFNINVGASSKYWANPSTYNIYRDNNLENTMLNGYGYLFFNIKYKTKNVKIKVEPRTIYEDEFKNKCFSLNNELEINYDIFNSKIKIIPYFLSLHKTNLLISLNMNHYNNSDLIINNHIASSLIISEVESNKRYKKFFGAKYIGIQFNKEHSINLEELSLYSNKDDWLWNDNSIKNYLDLYVGMEFEKFIFSWHFTNILSENYIINSSGHIENFYMKYFSVKWKFND